jgi:hypothetical protein
MKTLSLALLAAILAAAGPQETLVDNPEYQGWVGQKAGSWVKFSVETDTGSQKSPSTMILKLKEITPDKVVLEQVSIMEAGGKTVETPLTRTVPAKVKEGTNSEGAKLEKLAEGDEEIDVEGTKTKCHWAEMKATGKAGAMTIKVWRCEGVVGRTAKLIMTLEKSKMSMTFVAVEWKAGD